MQTLQLIVKYHCFTKQQLSLPTVKSRSHLEMPYKNTKSKQQRPMNHCACTRLDTAEINGCWGTRTLWAGGMVISPRGLSLAPAPAHCKTLHHCRVPIPVSSPPLPTLVLVALFVQKQQLPSSCQSSSPVSSDTDPGCSRVPALPTCVASPLAPFPVCTLT